MFISMKLQPKYFEAIKSGRKTIEMRLWDDKRKHITVGDTIEFVNMQDDNQVVLANVIGVHVYPTFKELYRDYSKVELGYTEDEVASYKDMEQFYPLQQQEKFCVVGLEIRVIENEK